MIANKFFYWQVSFCFSATLHSVQIELNIYQNYQNYQISTRDWRRLLVCAIRDVFCDKKMFFTFPVGAKYNALVGKCRYVNVWKRVGFGKRKKTSVVKKFVLFICFGCRRNPEVDVWRCRGKLFLSENFGKLVEFLPFLVGGCRLATPWKVEPVIVFSRKLSFRRVNTGQYLIILNP